MQKIGDITDTADGNGEFTDGNVAGNVQPTELMAAWFNSVQRELIAVLTAAGLTPDKTDDAQLIAAINAILAKGIAGSGYLMAENNLSDLKDAAESRGHLGLGKLAVLDSLTASDVGAVQQGGGTGMGTNKVYLGWSGSKLIVQVDSAVLGELFYNNNPPTKSTVGLGNVGNFMAVQQGGGVSQNTNKIYLGWGTDGKLRLSVDTTDMGAMYYENNPPPIASSAVTSVRLGSEVVKGIGSPFRPNAGHVCTGFSQATSYQITEYYSRPLQVLIGGTWLTIGQL